MTATAAKKVGLRFKETDADKLQALADRVKADDLRADASAFEQAAVAARTREPLLVTFDDEQEVLQMVAAYVLYGVEQPVIEELSI